MGFKMSVRRRFSSKLFHSDHVIILHEFLVYCNRSIGLLISHSKTGCAFAPKHIRKKNPKNILKEGFLVTGLVNRNID